MEMENFEQNDWAHMHDCILHVRGTSTSQGEMEAIFQLLPESMKGDARQWGMSDTLWRDQFIAWLGKEGQKIVLPSSKPEKNGLNCPKCGSDLYDTTPDSLLLSAPPKKAAHCRKCDFVGYRTV